MNTDRMLPRGSTVSLVVPRLDEKPWGGRKLADYGLELPPDAPIGEALVTAGEATIEAGDGEGRTIQDLVDADPAARLGARAQEAVSGRALFPLLVKLIDAAENLSIQVHPDDEGARALDRLGKTEAWYVLKAEPGARIYIGLEKGADFGDFMTLARKLDGSSGQALRAIEAQPGSSVVIPAGTVHALGAGVMVYEIQQPSDVTFRLDDWGRVDAQGNPREMHLEQGQEASRPELRPEWINAVDVSAGMVSRHLLTACRYFALEQVRMPVGASIQAGDPGSPHVLTLLSGAGVLVGNDTSVELEPGSSGIIWPGEERAIFTAIEPVELLHGWVPDIARDIVEVARAAGASDAAIRALGGETGDIDAVLDA